MKKQSYPYIACLLTFIMLCFAKSLAFGQYMPPADQIDYHLSWDGESSILLVSLYYISSDKDSLVFTYGNPTPGGLYNIFDIISNIETDDANDQLRIDSTQRKIIVKYQSSGLKALHYHLDGKLIVDPKRARPNEAFRPTIAPGFLYTLGYNLYLDVEDDTYTYMSVVWDHYPAKMNYFISCAPKAKANERQIVPMDKRNSLLIQMNENLVVKKYKVNKIPNYLITSKSDTVNKMSRQMKPFLSELIPQMRKFWQDDDFDFYFVSMIPLRNQMPSTMTGIGLINGFGTRYSGPLDKDKTAVIAHEISHTWIGVRMQFKSESMENEWFDEGFNDYMAIYSLVQAGMFDQADFLHYVNKEVLGQYYNNPANASPADSIAANFWKSKNYEKIPYHRGFIYAFYLDNQIRLASGGRHSIKDFMVKLYQECRQQKKQVIVAEDFAEAIASFLSKDQVLSEIQTYMLDGKLINFRQVKLMNAFQIDYQDKIPVLKLSEKVELRKLYP